MSLDPGLVEHLRQVLVDPGSGLDLSAAAPTASDAGPMPPAIGPYVPLRELGRGGMGVIYEATSPDLAEPVAVKVLAPWITSDEAVARFHREARLLATLDHPGVVRVLDDGTDGATHYLVMELLEGRPLSRVLLDKRIHAREAATWIAAAARALAHAHERDVLHRDVKPGNLFLTTEGRVVVTDFGLAWGAEESRLTRSQVGMGTPAYMAPEQLLGESVDARADVYGLGATLYELLALAPPYDERDPRALMVRIVQGDPPPVRDRDPRVPAPLEAVVLQCLHRHPDRRYATMTALADDLDGWLASGRVRARLWSWRDRLRRVVARHRALTAAVVATLLTAAVAVGWLAAQTRERAAAQRARVAAADKAVASAEQAVTHFTAALSEAEGRWDARTPPRQLAVAYRALRRDVARARAACHDALRFVQAARAHDPASRRLRGRERVLYASLRRMAEATRDERAAATWAGMLAHLSDAPPRDAVPVALTVEPPGAAVRVGTFFTGVRAGGDLALAPPTAAGGRLLPPDGRVRLPPGSHWFLVTLDGHHDAVLPVRVERGRPQTLRCRLVPRRDWNAGMRHVPAGRGLIGGVSPWVDSPGDPAQLRRPVSLPDLLVMTDEVSARDYAAFVVEMARRETTRRLRRYLPLHGDAPLWQVTDGPRVVLASNDIARGLSARAHPESDAPMSHVTAEAAAAYARWRSHVTGARHRLPSAIEWERAATGADGRPFPWGFGPLARAAQTRFFEELGATGEPGAHDVSVYGVRHCYGRVTEWTSDHTRQLVSVRGWNYQTPLAPRVAQPQQAPRWTRAWVGFRLVVEVAR